MDDEKIHSNHGFTLMETVISIVIFGIVGILLVQIVGAGATVYETVFNGMEIRDNLYLAQRRFNNDVFGLRDIQHILYADRTRFKFIDSRVTIIQYRYDNGKLYRSVNDVEEFPIAQYMTDSTAFFYYTISDSIIDEDPLSSGSLSSIWRVRLDLYGAKGSQTVKIQTAFFPQNLKFGVVK